MESGESFIYHKIHYFIYLHLGVGVGDGPYIFKNDILSAFPNKAILTKGKDNGQIGHTATYNIPNKNRKKLDLL